MIYVPKKTDVQGSMSFDLFTDYELQPEPAPFFDTPFTQAVISLNDMKTPKPTEVVNTPSSNVHQALRVPADRKLTDFGEKIGGAKKDLYGCYRDVLVYAAKQNVRDTPVAKLWPKPKYQKILDTTNVEPWKIAAIRALREAVDRRPPATSYRLYGWENRFVALRDLATAILNGELAQDNFEAGLLEAGKDCDSALYLCANTINNQFKLYEALGHDNDMAPFTVSFRIGRINYDHPELAPKKFYQVSVKLPNHYMPYPLGEPEHYAGVVQCVKSFLNLQRKNEEANNSSTSSKSLPKRTQDDSSLYLVRKWKTKSKDGIDGYIFIGRKVNKEWVELKAPFKTWQEARDYKENHLDEIIETFKKFKYIPNDRESQNVPREAGTRPVRNANVTPEEFLKAFGFRGVEFGNWVENDKRQGDLNLAYDALTDLAYVLRVPTRALSLDGTLGLRFGSNGSGGKNAAAAHYEPATVAINLTKKHGAGSLAHEWFHALDHYFSSLRGNRQGNYMTESKDTRYIARRGEAQYAAAAKNYPDGVRKEIILGFSNLVKAFESSGLKERSQELDNKRTKDYWSTNLEMGARSFEVYVKDALAQVGVRNDYLANIRSYDAWQKEIEACGVAEQAPAYPYPLPGEMDAYREAFDSIIDAMEYKVQDNEDVALYSTSNYEDVAALKSDCIPCADDLLTDSQLAMRKFAEEVLELNLRYFDGPAEYHGRYVPTEDTVYLNQASEKPLDWTIWHESFHAMKQLEPALYQDILDGVEKTHPITPEQIAAFKEAVHGPNLSDSLCKEELLANAFADSKTRTERLQEQSTGIAGKITAFMGTIAAKARSYFGKSNDRLTQDQFKDFEHGIEKMASKVRDDNGKHTFQVTKAHKILTADQHTLEEYLHPCCAELKGALTPKHKPNYADPKKEKSMDTWICKELLKEHSPKETQQIMEVGSAYGSNKKYIHEVMKAAQKAYARV